VEDPHPERLGPLRDRATDSAEADDAQRRAADVPAEKVRVGPTAGPAALADGAVAGDDPPSDREQKSEGKIGGRSGQDAGRIRDRDAARGAGADVDRVVADAVVRNEVQVREQVQRLVIDFFTDDGERLDLVAAATCTFRKRPGQTFDIGELRPRGSGKATGGEDLQGAAILSALTRWR